MPGRIYRYLQRLLNSYRGLTVFIYIYQTSVKEISIRIFLYPTPLVEYTFAFVAGQELTWNLVRLRGIVSYCTYTALLVVGHLGINPNAGQQPALRTATICLLFVNTWTNPRHSMRLMNSNINHY